MKTGSGPSPPTLLGKAYDIHRMTAEQQAARAALQTMGLQVPFHPEPGAGCNYNMQHSLKLPRAVVPCLIAQCGVSLLDLS